jgi:transposase
MHHCHDLLLFQIHHPRWAFVYQPKYAADLNRIEPWWKVLRSLALKGRRVETWEEIATAIEAATADCRRINIPSFGGSGVATVPFSPSVR